MKFDVVWEDNARSEVAAKWVNSRDKVAIIDAIAEFDKALGTDPIGSGRPLSEGLYFIDRLPLRAIYSVDEAGLRVEIGRIRRIQ